MFKKTLSLTIHTHLFAHCEHRYSKDFVNKFHIIFALMVGDHAIMFVDIAVKTITFPHIDSNMYILFKYHHGLGGSRHPTGSHRGLWEERTTQTVKGRIVTFYTRECIDLRNAWRFCHERTWSYLRWRNLAIPCKCNDCMSILVFELTHI